MSRKTPPWAIKYRQIGFLREFGQDVSYYEYRTNPGKIKELLKGCIHENKRMKYWADDKDRDCFAIYARGLGIDNSDRSEYWQWKTDSDGIEVAQVVKGTWLGVSGSFRTWRLLNQVWYKVSFLLKMAPGGSMGGKNVSLKLSLPDNTTQEKQEKLPTPDRADWSELEVGRFQMTVWNTGEINFSMRQLFETWESGLIIKGIEIKPV